MSCINACRSSPKKIETEIDPYHIEAIEHVYWINDPLPAAWNIPEEVGFIGGNNILTKEQGIQLGELFKSAYLDSLLKDMPLDSVLSMDQLHVWPSDRPITWVQNWKTEKPVDNSFGIPNLVLAMLSAKEHDVWTCSGLFLDQYGKSSGSGKANGAAGYGTPCSDVFYVKEKDSNVLKYAQRFDAGLFTVNNNNTVDFQKEDIPSETAKVDKIVGTIEYTQTEQTNIKNKFIKAWKELVNKNGPQLLPDGPVQYVETYTDSWYLFSDKKLKGFYVQFFDNGTYGAVLPVIETEESKEADLKNYFLQSSLKCRIVHPKFFSILSKNIRVIGAENLAANKCDTKSQTQLDAFVRGVALYGLPVTDLFLSENGTELIQRFTKGYLHDTEL
ncbi:MAG: hypothetical protein Ta2F_08030 [Termitinemataceae bacterium]|nr:MAG: hypothetical protein Ta2F_08030 [Termitinemataceae bacterium]